MKRFPPVVVLVLLVAFWAPALPAAQQTAPPASVTLSAEQMEAFLLNAKILGMRSAGSGNIGATNVSRTAADRRLYSLERALRSCQARSSPSRGETISVSRL